VDNLWITFEAWGQGDGDRE